MLLKKCYLTEAQVKKFFPAMIKENYTYFIEVCALNIRGRKTFLDLHLGVARERESSGMIFREILPQESKCLRATLDKPMREGQREEIYAIAGSKLRERAYAVNLPEDHPFMDCVKKM